jgi:hypothetical protein
LFLFLFSNPFSSLQFSNSITKVRV